MDPRKLNILALKNLKNNELSKAQLLFKRAILRAKVSNQEMTSKDYIDDIYNTNTETRLPSHKVNTLDRNEEENEMGTFVEKRESVEKPPPHNEQYLLFNSALLLFKRGRNLEALKVFSTIKGGFAGNFKFWYRFGQAAKGVFLDDLSHVSKLYDYYFNSRKKKFFTEKSHGLAGKGSFVKDDDLDDFVSFFGNLVDPTKNAAETGKKSSGDSLRHIIIKKKLVAMFKAKDLLGLTHQLYANSHR